MSNAEDESSNGYKEKIWTKDDGIEVVTDGYSFRGKRMFKKAWDGLKEHLKKGVQHEKDDIKYKALDVRKIGTGMEADVEIVQNGIRGISKLKLYGQKGALVNHI